MFILAQYDEKSPKNIKKFSAQENHQATVQRKGFPKIINTNSGVIVKSYAVEAAYAEIEPPKFYQKMCFSVWSRKDLAIRCVKKTKRRNQRRSAEELKELTPKKKRAIHNHFFNFLNFYDYPDMLYHLHVKKRNDYAHRAIVASRRFNDAMVEIELDEAVGNRDDDDSDMCEL